MYVTSDQPNQTSVWASNSSTSPSRALSEGENFANKLNRKMSSGFVTEAEVEERKKVRQEEWERVRKPSDPVTVPEEQVDNR